MKVRFVFLALGLVGIACSGSSGDISFPSDPSVTPPSVSGQDGGGAPVDAAMGKTSGGDAAAPVGEPSPPEDKDAGEVHVGCGAGLKSCGGQCVSADDPSTGCGDPSCTPCPKAAAGSPTCTHGECSFTCPSGYNLCSGTCVEESPSSCGASCASCDKANATGSCHAGKCSFTCADGFMDCDHKASNGCEVDTRFDAQNCGGCDVQCSTGSCYEGFCEGSTG